MLALCMLTPAVMCEYDVVPMSVFAVSIGPNASATGLDTMFRGTLIQTRPLGNDDMMVGNFAVIDAGNSRLSSCTPPEVITELHGVRVVLASGK